MIKLIEGEKASLKYKFATSFKQIKLRQEVSSPYGTDFRLDFPIFGLAGVGLGANLQEFQNLMTGEYINNQNDYGNFLESQKWNWDIPINLQEPEYNNDIDQNMRPYPDVAP